MGGSSVNRRSSTLVADESLAREAGFTGRDASGSLGVVSKVPELTGGRKGIAGMGARWLRIWTGRQSQLTARLSSDSPPCSTIR